MIQTRGHLSSAAAPTARSFRFFAAMLFCPTDGSLLMVESGPQGWTRFCCQTCPYVHPMEPSDKITRKVPKTVISPHAACGHDCRVDQPAKQTGCSRLSHRVP